MKNIILLIFALCSYLDVSFSCQIISEEKPEKLFPGIAFPKKIICLKPSDEKIYTYASLDKTYKVDDVYFIPDDLICCVSKKSEGRNTEIVTFNVTDKKIMMGNSLAKLCASYIKPLDGDNTYSMNVMIESLNVHDQLRSQGLGSWLIFASEKFFLMNKELKTLHLSLICIAPQSKDSKGLDDKLAPEDKKRLALYTRLGFKKVFNWRKDHPFGWYMAKEITKSDVK